MRITPPESGYHIPDGYNPKSITAHSIKFKKPILWVSVLIFFAAIILGYSLGTGLVIKSGDFQPVLNKSLSSEQSILTVYEVTNLGLDKPDLLSIWFIHIMPGDNPVLGFTPVVTISMIDDPNFSILKEFSLDSNGYPSSEFRSKLNKIGVSSDGFIVLDQAAVAAFVNWFKGTDLSSPSGLSSYSMAEYGQLLRGMCNEFPLVAEHASGEFPWSMITPLHFRTSLGFDQVIASMSFLVDTVSPKCEMVPLP